MLVFPLYEHRYSRGNADIYACEPLYYPRETCINAGDQWLATRFMLGFPEVILTSTPVGLSITQSSLTSIVLPQNIVLGFPSQSILTSTLVNLSLPRQDLYQCGGPVIDHNMFMLGFPVYEHGYFRRNPDSYA